MSTILQNRSLYWEFVNVVGQITCAIFSPHTDCYFCSPISEDKLLRHASLLESYANSTYKLWDPKVKEVVGPPEVLCGCLGDGLIQFLKMQPKSFTDQVGDSPLDHSDGAFPESSLKRLVTKTPSVRDLPYFFKFFPRSHLLVVVRDGRSVAESAVKSFKWSYETAIRVWAQGARTILQFDRDGQNDTYKYLIVRYEDIFLNTVKELKKIFKFLGLDAEKYDFGSALSMKVSGSSDLVVHGEEKVHWQWVEKQADFNPIDRWNSWGRKLHERFNWIAGNDLEQLGYRPKIFKGGEIFWRNWNLLSDLKWKVQPVVRRLRGSLHI